MQKQAATAIIKKGQITKAIIFDLDNCLAAANEPGEQLYAPAFDAIRRENRGVVPEGTLNEAFADCWFTPLDKVAAKYGFSEAMLAAGWKVFAALEVGTPMRGYGDLAALSELPVLRFLVTSGFRRLQDSKIRALGIERSFTAIHVDAIDEPGEKGKRRIFEQFLNTYRIKPSEALVVGDSSVSEIEAGNSLGISTVQILRPGVPRADNANFHISSLIELKKLL